MTDHRTAIDAAAFHEALAECGTIKACMALFKGIIEPLGFDTYACGEVDLENRDRFVMFAVDWPPGWLEFYLGSRFNTHDPVLDALAYRSVAFTWTELRADRKLAKAGSELLRACAERGWVDGLVVPLARSGGRFGLVSLVSRQPVTSPDMRQKLALISTSFHARVRHLAPQEGFPTPPFGLTARELDCLNAVAEGLSDRAAGERLGISASTAHEYVESGKRRLKARSRSQAIAIAMSFGLLKA